MKKIYIYDNEGNLVKVAKSKEVAAAFANVSSYTVHRILTGQTKNTRCGYDFKYEGQEFKKSVRTAHNATPICKKDKDGNILKVYNGQNEASRDNSIPQPVISAQLRGKTSRKSMLRRLGAYFDYFNNETETKEIIKPKEQEYYINVLVGLVNNTLIEGAIYNLHNVKYIYNKKEQALIPVNGTEFRLKRDNLVVLCDIELPLLTSEEKDFITQLKKNISDIKTITKCKSYNGMEYIRIQGSNMVLMLDEFKEATKYKGLKLNQVYSLKDLDIK